MVAPFHKLFPDLAAEESRSLVVGDSDAKEGIPPGEYLFVESYCTNPDCDCERVVIDVVERRHGIVASVSYHFNSPLSPARSAEPNPALEPSDRQSPYAEEIVATFRKRVINDEYNQRLRRHYGMVKSAGCFFRDSYTRAEAGATDRRGEWARQKRKEQKAARRKNRRR